MTFRDLLTYSLLAVAIGLGLAALATGLQAKAGIEAVRELCADQASTIHNQQMRINSLSYILDCQNKETARLRGIIRQAKMELAERAR